MSCCSLKALYPISKGARSYLEKSGGQAACQCKKIIKPPSQDLPSVARVQTKSHPGLVLASKLQKPAVCLSCAPPLHPSHDPKGHSLYNQHLSVVEPPCQKGLAASNQEGCPQELPLQSTRSKAQANSQVPTAVQMGQEYLRLSRNILPS